MTFSIFGGILISLLGVCAAILLLIFVIVPLFKGVGFLIGGIFKGIGWILTHLFEFVFGIIGDAIRLVGGIPVFIIFGLLAVLNVGIGRWSAAGHFANAAKRECRIGGACIYRILVRRPLSLLMLHGLLEGFEERLPQAMEDAPGRDRPTQRGGQFDGYRIVGSLRGGGSGGKLYIAEPLPEKRAAIPTIPDRVVIKSFALAEGSSLPQIVRESRALECAKQLGHVIEHAMDEHRFHYVMPYIPGDHFGAVAHDMHARSDGTGLSRSQIADVMGYLSDLVATLSAYHEGGFWHKDVKPDNVIVHNGRAHLVDLGLVTSLGSPMTLTTHGTEYFRDPEMVRQALRGVKVHQVNGAKFDIYAAGAVLYFMLESTFPAHGVLSKFHKKSPDALHWIVRRAMAEYQQRYSTAQAMLADLTYVASAADSFAVKPAELPSMSGAEIPEVPVAAPDPSRVVSAGSPIPPKSDATTPPEPTEGRAGVRGFGVAAGIDSKGPFAQAGRINVDDQGRPIPPPKRGRRPRLRVVSWWTGAYEVEEPGTAAGAFEHMQERFNQRARPESGLGLAWHVARQEAQRARRSAKEQLHSARQRAHEMRRRAMAHRQRTQRAVAERQPGPMLACLVACVLVGGGLIVAGLFSTHRVRRTLVSAPFASQTPRPSAVSEAVFVINDLPRRNTTEPLPDRVFQHIHENIGANAAIIQNPRLADDLRPLLERVEQGDSNAEARLNELLAAQDAHAVIWFERDPEREGDAFRTHIHVVTDVLPASLAQELPAPNRPGETLIVLNDHPAMRDTEVIRSVNVVREHYKQQFGCSFVDDLEVESDVRVKFALFRISASDESREELESVLASNNLDGIVHITAEPNGHEDDDRMRITLFEPHDVLVDAD